MAGWPIHLLPHNTKPPRLLRVRARQGVRLAAVRRVASFAKARAARSSRAVYAYHTPPARA
jgi:hypothetical protein